MIDSSRKNIVKVYIVTHKETEMPNQDSYYPLLVGARSHVELKHKYLCDDNGENISEKNKSYCELTGLYWIWKNTSDNIIGLVHYRRFFAKVRGLRLYHRYFTKTRSDYELINEKDVANYLKNCDLLVKKSEKYFDSIERVFRRHSHIGDEKWEEFEHYFFKFYPEYQSAFKKTSERRQLINCNMFIGKKEVVDRYCEWLFPILDGLDDFHKQRTGKYYCNRELGYYGEFLFGTWLIKNRINYRIINAVNLTQADTEDAILPLYSLPRYIIGRTLPNWLKNLIKNLSYN